MGVSLIPFGTQIKCSHGGTVMPTGGNPRVKATGRPILMLLGGYPVAGCPFTIPTPGGPKPQPCIRVQWVTGTMRSKAGGVALLQNSNGLCFSAEGIMQGKAIILPVPPRVKSQ